MIAGTAYDRMVDALRDRGGRVTTNGNQAIAQCPVPGHGARRGDLNPSLSITGIEGQALLYCHAGCPAEDVMAALDKRMADLFDTRNGATYTYPDGRKVHRTTSKRFYQNGNTKGSTLFHADRVGDADTVYVPEGEKDVLAIEAVGGVAVCSAMGAGKAHKADWTPLSGRHVIIVADKDEPGLEHAREVAELLDGIATLVTVKRPRSVRTSPTTSPPARTRRSGRRVIPPRTTRATRATAQRQPKCQRIALLPRILDAVADEVRSRGLVGEERLAQTLYLVLTSRLLDKQVSAGVKGHSASGKSYTVETVTRFFPPEAYLEFTAMSERALVYSTEQYAHRTLIVYEVTALREGVEDDMTSYFVRSLLSEGRIDYEVTVRDKEGGFTTKKIVKQGPTNLIFTTTKTRVHAENETRILSLATDDSREQTARVLLELADESNGDGDLEPWRDLQRWLTDAEHRVTIPYARRLAQQVPPVAVRLRRDFGSVLALIRAHAVLHQASRDRDDDGPHRRHPRRLRRGARPGGRHHRRGCRRDGLRHRARDRGRGRRARIRRGRRGAGVAEKLQLDKSNVSRRLRVAADGGYLRNLEDKRGKPGRWVIGDPLPESVDLLPDPAQLATRRHHT